MGDNALESILIERDRALSIEETDHIEKDPVEVNLPLLQEETGLQKKAQSVIDVKDTSKDKAETLKQFTFCIFEDESQLKELQNLIDKELSEPYSIYTYRYFVYNWPDLCFFALDGDRYVGVIVCKLETVIEGVLQGYIAMLAVNVEYRKRGIGKALSEMAIEAMAIKNAAVIVLETELTNKAALALYQSLGFIREQRLLRYYVSGVDAFRLKLILKDSAIWLTTED
ncbi:N-alpha-acetyltransferase 30 [Drosophila eugracilis]|uniref:N-alpha-acetyltransferase 30 n=1 Tax=Drosophila eugracilis TaxID=29029 RepID=UPI0007E65204|nr:N-alpha-acetyltransferase 30 [Drosophila eugracilis]